MTEVNEKVGIEQTLEIFEGLKVLGVGVGSALADGKINVADLPILIGLLNDFSILYKSIEGFNEVGAEIKDLDQAELITLGTKGYELVKAIIESTKKVEA